MLGPDTIRRRCNVIAVMITQYGPHAVKHPFVVTLDTATAQAAYQLVLRLLTQTRLDGYEKRWDALCQGYEKALEICRAFLPRRGVLIGACLNNLIAHLDYRGERLAAVRHAWTLVAHSARRHGKRYAHEARQRLSSLILREQVPASLRCARIPVEQDGCGRIDNAVLIA